jgi:hypothetical protein
MDIKLNAGEYEDLRSKSSHIADEFDFFYADIRCSLADVHGVDLLVFDTEKKDTIQ